MFKQHHKALIFAISGKSVVSLDGSTVLGAVIIESAVVFAPIR